MGTATIVRDEDSRAAEEFLMRYEASVEKWVGFMMAGRGEERRDVVQDALLEAWASRDTIRGGEGSIKPWLRILTRNVVSRHYRREQIRKQVEFHDPRELEEDVAAERVSSALSRQLRIALSHLNEDEAVALTLRHVEEHRLEDVAALMGVSLSTVKRLLYRARGRARRLLKTDGFELLSLMH